MSTRAWRAGTQFASKISRSTSRWVAATPLGCPVEPDVWMT